MITSYEHVETGTEYEIEKYKMYFLCDLLLVVQLLVTFFT